jgi:hypothetical protein
MLTQYTPAMGNLPRDCILTVADVPTPHIQTRVDLAFVALVASIHDKGVLIPARCNVYFHTNL